ncbi:hypothetical protein PYW08_001839 [Mythimna loreyi]|uniref:Uncharacterized protein n=1 Tax=Mythimna loreyi TaxID=667449 RepID=A0ACC2RAG4_9NEOP|nr:hypothetical protein PYW08_001839 [Mythimna loreyi]
MRTSLYSFIFLIVLIQLFKVNEAANNNGTCYKVKKISQPYTKVGNQTVLKNNVNRTVTTQYVNANVSYCCNGYETVRHQPLTCAPKCSKSCGNGTCIAPDRCNCSRGYTFSDRTCKPVCRWKMLPNNSTKKMTCQPICTKPCANNTICVAPETCGCLTGYTKVNGTCVLESSKQSWVKSNWIYVLVIAIIVLVILLVGIIVIARCKRNSAEETA